jgi:hypothetical protein
MILHNFKDGRGPVEAYQHPRGGGWVADTASVADTTFVGPRARIYGNATVGGSATVSGNAKVYGNASVYGDAKIFEDSTCSKTPVSVSPSVFEKITITDNFVHINDQTFSFSDTLPLEEPYLSFVKGIIDQRRPQVDGVPFWERL